MKMENLNKTQIVLLTLLTSFVTSIATGIVTVTLMEQAPPAVTRTIDRVINKTIQTIVPSEKQITTVIKKVVVVKEKDLIVSVVEKASKSLVHISAVDKDGSNVSLGIGVVVSKDGIIIAYKNKTNGNRNNLIISSGGKFMKIKVLSEKNNFVILKVVEPDNGTTTIKNVNQNKIIKVKEKTKYSRINLTSASLLLDSNSVKLGQTIIVLGGEDGRTVLTGIVSRLDMKTSTITTDLKTTNTNTNKDNKNKISKTQKTLKYIVPSFKISKKGAGGPTLDMDGNLIGVNVITKEGKVLSVPVSTIEKALSDINKPTKDFSTVGKIINTKFATSSDNLTKSK